MENLVFILILLYVAAVILLFRGYYNSVRHKRLIQDVPTSKTTGVFIGLVELKGTAESENPLIGHLSRAPCVWYNWNIKEEWRRQRTVITTDAKGRISTKVVTESGWDVIAQGGDSQTFYLKDDSGVIRIQPEKAQIEAKAILSKTCRANDPFYNQFGPHKAVFGSTGKRSFWESGIPLHNELYVLGRSRVREDVVAAELAWDKEAPLFLISTSTEEEMIKWRHALSIGYGILFTLLTGLGGGFAARDSKIGVLVGLGGTVLLGVSWLWLVHRSMVELRNRTRRALANIDVELKRRHDLISRLIEVVKGMKNHERELMKSVARLRTQSDNAKSHDAGFNGKLAPIADMVRGMIECYPELNSNDLFLNLHRNLADTEQRVALARHYYNDMVTYVDHRREKFPDNLIALLTGLKKFPYFTVNDFEAVPVEVHLNEE